MDKIEAVWRMQEYIETHYLEKITMNDLAKVSYYSPWYSYRLFKEYTNLSIADYIRRYRLSKSALELRDNNVKIIDIAHKYDFHSVDGYQRAFFKEFGMNPYEYSKNPTPICLFIPFKVYVKGEERKMKESAYIFISIVEKPSRKVIIKRGIKANNYFDYCNEVGCDVWGIVTSIKSISGEPVSMWLPEHLIKEGTSIYAQGAEVPLDYNGVIPDGFDIIELPYSKYIMFQGEPFEEENYEEAITLLWKAIKKYDPDVLGYVYDKSNPIIQLEPIGTRGYIELHPIKNK